MIAGVVLAGGASRRMGVDKARVALAGRPMIAHVLDRLAPQVGRVAIAAGPDGERLEAFGLPLLSDPAPQGAGPLAGLIAGLDWAAEAGFDQLATVPCDTPFLPETVVAELAAAGSRDRRPETVSIAVSIDPTGRRQGHPSVALWPVAARDRVREAFAAGVRRLRDAAAAQGTVEAELSGPSDALLNVNSPEDLLRAEAILAAGLR